ncbi:RNA-directed DNA polymerase, eukaryota [Tanacetum coccineum]
MGIPYQNSLQSKADQTAKISKSVYVSNFPEGCSSKDIWKVCSEYGTVVDVFIPNKKSKVGKRFAFVRPKKPNLHPNNVAAASNHSRGVDYVKGHVQPGSFANIVSGHPPVGAYGPSVSSLSALVLDETCAIDRDLSNNFMGKVKDVSSISNLRALIMDEGFSVGNLIYLGGMWVMIECENVELKTKMMQHTGVKSWFQVIHNATLDFVSDERIVWVDIEGIPINVWSRETFKRIEKKWGDVMDIEDNVGDSFGRKRICIKTKQPLSILESFKVIFKGGDPNEASPSLSHPPGFTPVVSVARMENDQLEKEVPDVVSAKVMNNSQEVSKEDSGINMGSNVGKTGGSVLRVLEDMIQVGKAMGYSMDGCEKDVENIIGSQGAGGILCVWEASVFKKDYATISDNFIAVYGTWLPTNSKVLFVAIYAPQQLVCKRLLWDYVSSLIDRWNGEVIVLGDFNEVRVKDERRGSCFNVTSARVFDQFISGSGLVDVKMEGYAFTWSHPSGSKMSKLDRFLVSEGLIRFKKKLQDLKVQIRSWVNDKRRSVHGEKDRIKNELSSIDKLLDCGDVSESHLLRRSELQRNLYKTLIRWIKGVIQKSKAKGIVVGDENSKFFHGLINKKRSQLAIHGVFLDGIWCTNPSKIKEAFFNHFRVRFQDARVLVTKVLANRLALVISDLVSDSQSAFIANRQILDGPFILNELLHWCKRKKKQAMFFRVDFAKAYDSVRWDYLLDVLKAFGFGNNWCKWIRGTFSSAKASVLVNGSPTIEFFVFYFFHYICGLKQGDPLSPYLFILIIESLNMSLSRAIDEGVFKGIQLHRSISISHLFYADDAMFIGEWSDTNLKGIINILQCFFFASGLKINIDKSKVLGVGVPSSIVVQAASNIGCGVFAVIAISDLRVYGGRVYVRRQALYGSSIDSHPVNLSSNWCSIIRELHFLAGKGFLFVTHCKKRIGNGRGSQFWFDTWLGDMPLKDLFPRLFALDLDSEATVAAKMQDAVSFSFRRPVRDGVLEFQIPGGI